MKEASAGTAQVYGGSVELEIAVQSPAAELQQGADGKNGGLSESDSQHEPCFGTSANASEDFALVADRAPSVFMYLSAGFQDERGEAPAHNPKVRFNQDMCAAGPAFLAHCAAHWLEELE